ncbi:thiaminase II [Pediococcus pentosaceus]|jgi:thiaminase/transcriptional activator TenA|uniref:thiaminase II n=1 Tax=Pediococcus TaxID=1253 RepID=UPI0013744413|nr:MULTISPECIES: thiaminase II [Pediococcus]KAF5438467.1 thiaminase II [Pediococcus sp. EKM202D]KAF5438570.1 thiaminase II [Pediococcus sp. EKM201D]MCS8571609.1 thiaminase II [Pediococcus pentosaceus]QHO68043.1 Aminopyrimidine aminohydrolase [Pediococcus pentosaceus]WKF71640.1 thiaminase II [Pediococcus pentosaceus]
MFSARLKAIAQPVLADIENHPFVRGIQAGAVPAAALMVYVEQDTCFLDAFAKVYAGALSKCTTKDQMRFFEEQIRYTLNDEAGAHQILCDIAGQKLSDHQHAEQRPITYLYNEHLFNALRTGDLIDLIAAMLPCPWTYTEISQQIVDGAAPDNPFLPWIEFYQPQPGQIDDSMVKTLFGMVDELAIGLSEERQHEIEQRFLRSCELEYEFWEQAYYQKDWKYKN